jgi:hypothetical protein
MSASATPWTGRWTGVDEPLAETDALVSAIASRRDCDPETVADELARIDAAFDVDAVYL